MTRKPPIVRRVYRLLLRLYPRPFRERLGESMEQTFGDLYNQHVMRSVPGRAGWLAWIFAETGAGIVREYVLLIKERCMKNTVFAGAGLAAALGLLLVLPFAILEYAYNIRHNPLALSAGNLGGLTVLFGLLWLLPALFFAVLTPMLRTVRAGNTLMARPVLLALQVGLLLLLAWIWGSLVLDQLPCFLGMPNCD